MTDPVDRPDPDRIWLEPSCCADPSEGRTWCADNVWPNGDCDIQAPGVEYVRADLAGAERDRLVTEVARLTRRNQEVDAYYGQAKREVHEAEAERDRLAAENVGLREDMQWFLDRVDRGEVRSTQTAARFRASLGRVRKK